MKNDINSIAVVSSVCMIVVLYYMTKAYAPWWAKLVLILLTGFITGFLTWAARLPEPVEPLDKNTIRRWDRLLVHRNGSCQKIFIPPKYCTIYLQNTKSSDVEIDMVGDDTCIQVLNTKKFKCMQDGWTLDGDKWMKVKK